MFDFRTQSGLIRLLGALVVLFGLLWILRSLTLMFQKDYFTGTDYTVDCATGLIKPTGSAPAVAAADQPANGGVRYEFDSGNIVDTNSNSAIVGTLPTTCNNYVWSNVWNAATSSYGTTLTWQAAPSSPFAAGGGTDSQFSMDGTNADPTLSDGTTTDTSSTDTTATTATAAASGTTTVSPATTTTATTTAATPATTTTATVPATSAALSAANAPLGTAAGAGTGTSLSITTASGLIPSLANCQQYYSVGWN